ncbi:aldehyde ferredoxin oxidoreductase family protein [Chloroflexota bacterium]
MVFGITGKIVRVDLSTSEVSIQSYPITEYQKFLGSDGLAAKILYNELTPGISCWDKESPVIFASGPLVGTTVPSSCTVSVTAKSPFTLSTMYSAHANGGFARMLKFAGYDAVIVKGISPKPVYLYINESDVQIRDAIQVWGKNTDETDDLLRLEVNIPKASCLCIGPAGENIALQAAMVVDKKHIAARGGIGAIVGSKKLKGIVVYGQKKVTVADINKLDECVKKWRELNTSLPWCQTLKKYGSAAVVDQVYAIGDLPIKNFTHGVLEGWEKLTGQNIIDNLGMLKRHTTCPSCILAHTKDLVLKGDSYDGEEVRLPEYEMIAAMGSNLGITEPDQVCKGADYLDKLGLDGLATSNVIGLIMECFERGMITKEQLGDIDAHWGNHAAAMELARQIAFREGFGNVMADGSLIAANYIGQGAEKSVVHIKRMPLPMHDHRSAWGYALQYAVGSMGPVHEGGPLFPEMQGMVPRMSVDGKAGMVKTGQELKTLLNCLGCCSYGSIGIGPDLQVETLNAVTGWNITKDEAFKSAERILNLRRAFNLKNGLKPEDDTLPERYLNDPPPDGGSKGSRVNIKPMVHEYYKIMGWDEVTGKPFRRTLEELDLAEIAKDLWR